MRRAVVLLAVAGVLAAMVPMVGGAATAQTAAPTELHAFMTGEQVALPCLVAPCADPNGWGVAVIRVHKERACYTLEVRRIKPATAAHIHLGVRGVIGPMVVPLNAPKEGSSSGCVGISRALSIQLREHPGRYYVDVHNKPYPEGAIRSQLHR
jgi:CHRD domain